ncbi:MAG: hypothetical protein JXR10_05235 [Cyclobacteriaceae bacterium]
MKKLIAILSFLITLQSFGQISYKIIEDDPSQIKTSFVGIGIGFEGSVDNALMIAAPARMSLSNGMAVEGIVGFDAYKLGGKGPTFLLDGGLFLPLSAKTKTKDVRIVTAFEMESNAFTGERTETTRFFMAPATVDINYGARGGAYFRTAGVEQTGFGEGTFATIGGIYLGGQMTSKAFVNTEVEGYKNPLAASAFTRVFFDLMVLPVSSVDDTTFGTNAKKDKLIGWRTGLQMFGNAHKGAKGFFTKAIYTMELGSRPLTGLYFQFIYSMPIVSF